jgi:hypothetical protein
VISKLGTDEVHCNNKIYIKAQCDNTIDTKKNVDGIKTRVKCARMGCCKWYIFYVVTFHGREKCYETSSIRYTKEILHCIVYKSCLEVISRVFISEISDILN